jgi:ribosomal protein L11 methylase PrmA
MSWLDDACDADSEHGLERIMLALHPPLSMEWGGGVVGGPVVAAAEVHRIWIERLLLLLRDASDDAARAEVAEGAVLLRLPQMGGWGMGSHATTQLMCRWLQSPGVAHALCAGAGRLCDFGCGSGVLALAATALLPGVRACGVDIEPPALVAARANAVANGVATRCTFHLPPSSFLEHDLDFFARFGDPRSERYAADCLAPDAGPFDVVVANILPGPLARLAPTLCRMLRPGGLLALAGCQAHQVAPLIARYAEFDVALRPVATDNTGGEWVLLATSAGEAEATAAGERLACAAAATPPPSAATIGRPAGLLKAEP